MTIYNLPWVIGPLPIALTVWSACVCCVAILYRGQINGAKCSSAILFPAGLCSIVSELFLQNYNIVVLSLASQFTSCALFFIFLFTSTSISGRRARLAKSLSATGYKFCLKNILIFSSSYLGLNLCLLLIPTSNKCSTGKCFVLEFMFGKRDHVFAKLYLIGIVECAILVGLISSAHLLVLKMRCEKNP